MNSVTSRSHLRAPLKGDILYVAEGHGLVGRCQNISSGGILVESLPLVPKENFPLMIHIPKIPLFSAMSKDSLAHLSTNSVDGSILRTVAKIMRTFEGQSTIDQVFVTQLGCQFVEVQTEAQEIIEEYVNNFAKNIIYLLKLFDSSHQQQVDLLKRLSTLLGYQAEEKIPLLRQQLLHDYQSLESL